MYYKCLELRPHREFLIKGRLPNNRRRIPHGVQTLVAVAQPTTNESKSRDEEPGGDGEVEGRALDSMDKLHRERIVFKGTDHVMQLLV